MATPPPANNMEYAGDKYSGLLWPLRISTKSDVRYTYANRRKRRSSFSKRETREDPRATKGTVTGFCRRNCPVRNVINVREEYLPDERVVDELKMSEVVRGIPEDKRKKQRKRDHSRDIRIFGFQPSPFGHCYDAHKNTKSKPQNADLVRPKNFSPKEELTNEASIFCRRFSREG